MQRPNRRTASGRSAPVARGRRGFMLLEASLTTAIIALSLLSLITVFALTLRANVDSEAVTVATHLSRRLMEEIRLRRWDERTPTPSNYTRRRSTIGRDGLEDSADKRTFDDIDDFNGWTETPPRDPLMNVLAVFSMYSSSVAVRYVDPTTLAPSGGTTDFKRITVCTWRVRRKSVCLDTLLTNH